MAQGRGSQFQGDRGLSQSCTHSLRPLMGPGSKQQGARSASNIILPHGPTAREAGSGVVDTLQGSENSVCDRASCLRQGWGCGAMPNNAVGPPSPHPASDCPSGRHLHRRCCCQMDTKPQCQSAHGSLHAFRYAESIRSSGVPAQVMGFHLQPRLSLGQWTFRILYRPFPDSAGSAAQRRQPPLASYPLCVG